MKIMNEKLFQAIFLGALLFFVAAGPGCEKEKMADPKGELETVSAKYWDDRFIKKDYKESFKVEMNRDGLPYEEYLKRVKDHGQIGYASVRVEDVRVDGDKGTLKAKLKINLPLVPKPVPYTITDHWVIDNNQWKHDVMPKK